MAYLNFFVGLIILAIGSDLPELAVAIDTGIRTLQGLDVDGIVTGACIGSAFGQIVGVMGIAGLLGYLVLPKHSIYQHRPIMLGSILILGLTGYDGQINRVEELILLIIFLLYVFVILGDRHFQAMDKQEECTAIPLRWLQLTGGMVLIFLASNLTIDSYIRLSTFLGGCPRMPFLLNSSLF